MKQHKYSYETRLAAAKAVVDDKKDVVSVMRAYSIFSPSPLYQWCALYRKGGAEALIQKKRGRELTPIFRTHLKKVGVSFL